MSEETSLKDDIFIKFSSEKKKKNTKKLITSLEKDQNMIKIKLKSYDHKVLDNISKQIIEIILRYTSEVIGPIPLPTKIKKYTVNRSTFIHKKSRDQFEIRVHSRLINVFNSNPKVIEALTNFNLPSSINVQIKFL